ncbi:MAG: family 10 glycosylhydrolase, partial [Rhodothermales bacterium]|nr:family 10 glycosylhydrolase [Rhodothermales bacterium]
MKQVLEPLIRYTHIVLIAAGMVVSLSTPEATAQSPRFEMRGAWIATVRGLDWPVAGSSSAAQQASLESIMDGLAANGVNAVFFQVRTEADAMYASDDEPWSAHLTGVQGRAPDPFYDPIAQPDRLAHERGMEQHACVNPFRAISNAGSYEIDEQHITVREPDWILDFGSLQMLDPGIPEVRSYVVDVVTDIVARYDVDGIHFDDYFYPYNPQVGTHDLETWQTYGGEFSNIADWRRDNINRFVESVHDAVIGADATVKFGISPFGIWQSGNPEGVTGLSAYDVIYADAVHWLGFETIDYLAPQLYWPFGGGQDFGLLADWWASVSNGRHIYPGLAAYKVDAVTAGGTQYAADELPRQIRYSRDAAGVQGNLLFRAQNLFSSQN